MNNVGISYEYAMYLEELPEDRLQTIIHLNCEVTAMVTKLCVPGMVERKRGAVVSISSAAGIMAIRSMTCTLPRRALWTCFLALSPQS